MCQCLPDKRTIHIGIKGVCCKWFKCIKISFIRLDKTHKIVPSFSNQTMCSMIREGLSRTCFTGFLDMHRHSAIDTKSLARDITSFWQTEKTDGSCDFIGGTKASQWGGLEHEFALLFCDARGEFRRYKT